MIRRLSNLETEKIDHQLWRLTRRLLYINTNGFITIPAGFITDGASCPKILWSLCSPMTGPQAEAAVMHDWFYSKDSGAGLSRKQADRLFFDAMIENGTGRFKANLIYSGVRMGGSASWKKCYSLDKIKEK